MIFELRLKNYFEQHTTGTSTYTDTQDCGYVDEESEQKLES